MLSLRTSSPKSLHHHPPCQMTQPSHSRQLLLQYLFPQMPRNQHGTTSLRRSWKLSVNMCRTSRLCRWVLSSLHPLYTSIRRLSFFTSDSSPDIRTGSLTEQYNRSGYHPPLVPQSKQAPQFPAQVPHPGRGHRRTILERAAMGYSIHRERELHLPLPLVSCLSICSKRVAQYGLFNMFLANARHVPIVHMHSILRHLQSPSIFLSFYLSGNKRRRSSRSTNRTARIIPMRPS